MMPDNITSEKIAQWEKKRLKFMAKNEFPISIPEDVFYSGQWLGEELAVLGCPDDLIEKICFAVGQRCSPNEDNWSLAVKALENYKQGHWEEPGSELAAKIIKERYGENPDPYQMLNDLEKRYGKEGLKALMSTLAKNGPPKEPFE